MLRHLSNFQFTTFCCLPQIPYIPVIAVREKSDLGFYSPLWCKIYTEVLLKIKTTISLVAVHLVCENTLSPSIVIISGVGYISKKAELRTYHIFAASVFITSVAILKCFSQFVLDRSCNALKHPAKARSSLWANSLEVNPCNLTLRLQELGISSSCKVFDTQPMKVYF